MSEYKKTILKIFELLGYAQKVIPHCADCPFLHFGICELVVEDVCMCKDLMTLSHLWEMKKK